MASFGRNLTKKYSNQHLLKDHFSGGAPGGHLLPSGHSNGFLPAKATVHVEDELAKVNHQMYERSVELAVRNRTLLILRKMYEVINTSLGLEETAQKLVDAIVSELKFQKGFIARINKDTKEVYTIAASNSPQQSHRILLESLGKPFQSFKVSLKEDDNYCVKSILYKKPRMTNTLYDVLVPHVNKETADIIQEKIMIKTSVVYPIIFGGEVLGILTLCMDKHLGDLSRAERETLKEVIEVLGIAIERAQIYADLKDANERLKELDKLKDEFVSLASHELRTPMTAIKSYLWLALTGRGGALSEKQKFYLERAYNSTTRLIKLVNDMLNTSRIESGRVTLEMAEVDLVKITEEAIGEVKAHADEIGISVVLDLGDGVGNYSPLPPEIASTLHISRIEIPHVLADTDKVKEVLLNFIGNSLKFTPWGGRITVSFKVEGEMVIVSVKDTGIGILPEDMSKLFKKFSLMKSSYQVNKNTSGTGLGLYLSKSLIELHKGQVVVTSEGRGKGSTFSFSLPVFTQQGLEEFNKSQEGKPKTGIIPTHAV